MAVKTSLELLETDLVKHLSEIQARNIKWIILIPPEESQKICEIGLILTNISYEIENMSTSPHKIRFIKTSTRKKSNQLKSLPSCLFLANSDPAPAYAQLVVLYNKIRAGHTTFLLLITNMYHTNNFSKQTCPRSHRMLVTESKHRQPQKGWNITFPQRTSSCSLTSRRQICLSSLLRTPLTHASLFNLLCLLFQKGIYWTSQATTCWTK